MILFKTKLTTHTLKKLKFIHKLIRDHRNSETCRLRLGLAASRVGTLAERKSISFRQRYKYCKVYLPTLRSASVLTLAASLVSQTIKIPTPGMTPGYDALPKQGIFRDDIGICFEGLFGSSRKVSSLHFILSV